MPMAADWSWGAGGLGHVTAVLFTSPTDEMGLASPGRGVCSRAGFFCPQQGAEGRRLSRGSKLVRSIFSPVASTYGYFL